MLREVRLVGDPACLGPSLPSLSVLLQLLTSFEANLRSYERHLQGTRRQEAHKRRQCDPTLIFRDIRPPSKAPVESLLDSRKAEIVEVCPEDSSVVLGSEVVWDCQTAFHANDAPLHVIHSEPDKRWVDDVGRLAPGYIVEQHRAVGSLLEIFSEFGRQWGARWMRHGEVDPARWQALVEGLHQIASFPEMHLAPITLHDWKAEVRSKSSRTAAGPDGLSRDDLLQLPDCLTLQIIEMCHTAERSGEWPQQLLEGIVSSLEKVPGAAHVADYRPICVLSVVSSLRAKAALQHLARYSPVGLFGNLPGCSSADVWMQIQLAIERGHLDNRPLFGLSADLTKAFNMVPRVPVIALSRLCGLPENLCRPWLSAITGFLSSLR